MKLSEAILLGSTMAPQGVGGYERNGKTCALGAAGQAVGLHGYEIGSVWLWSREGSVPCPVCRHDAWPISVIAHLNDTHTWTRERIAEWVAKIEPKEETAEQVNEPELVEVKP